jgi:benzylsuccinate CoA-transferase BbsF subunit
VTQYAYPDALGALHGLTAVIAALAHRARTGEGQLIDLAQYESTISLLGTSVLEYTMRGSVAGQQANRSAAAAPHGVYRCAGPTAGARSRYTRRPVAGLRAAMGMPAWQRPQFQDPESRRANDNNPTGSSSGGRAAILVTVQRLRHGVPAGVVQTSAICLRTTRHIAGATCASRPT